MILSCTVAFTICQLDIVPGQKIRLQWEALSRNCLKIPSATTYCQSPYSSKYFWKPPWATSCKVNSEAVQPQLHHWSDSNSSGPVFAERDKNGTPTVWESTVGSETPQYHAWGVAFWGTQNLAAQIWELFRRIPSHRRADNFFKFSLLTGARSVIISWSTITCLSKEASTPFERSCQNFVAFDDDGEFQMDHCSLLRGYYKKKHF
jgi:hypothetical protein